MGHEKKNKRKNPRKISKCPLLLFVVLRFSKDEKPKTQRLVICLVVNRSRIVTKQVQFNIIISEKSRTLTFLRWQGSETGSLNSLEIEDIILRSSFRTLTIKVRRRRHWRKQNRTEQKSSERMLAKDDDYSDKPISMGTYYIIRISFTIPQRKLIMSSIFFS